MNNQESLDAFLPHPWKSYFYLHELTEIVRQQSDPTFAEVMSRVRVGKHTQEDIVVLKNMSCKCCKKIVVFNVNVNVYVCLIGPVFPFTFI